MSDFNPRIEVNDGNGLSIVVRPDNEKFETNENNETDITLKFQDEDIEDNMIVRYVDSDGGRNEISSGVFSATKYPIMSFPSNGENSWNCQVNYNSNVPSSSAATSSLHVEISKSSNFTDVYTEELPINDTSKTLDSLTICKKFGLNSIIFVRLKLTLQNAVIRTRYIQCKLFSTSSITLNNLSDNWTGSLSYSKNLLSGLVGESSLTVYVSGTEDFQDSYTETISITSTSATLNFTQLFKKFTFNQFIYVKLKMTVIGNDFFSEVKKTTTLQFTHSITSPKTNTTNWTGDLNFTNGLTSTQRSSLTYEWKIEVSKSTNFSSPVMTKTITNLNSSSYSFSVSDITSLGLNTTVYIRLKLTHNNNAFTSSYIKVTTYSNFSITLGDLPANEWSGAISFSKTVLSGYSYSIVAEISNSTSFQQKVTETVANQSSNITSKTLNISNIIKKFNFRSSVYVRLKMTVGNSVVYSSTKSTITKKAGISITSPTSGSTNWLGSVNWKNTESSSVFTLSKIDIEISSSNNFTSLLHTILTKIGQTTTGTVSENETVFFNSVKPYNTVYVRIKARYTITGSGGDYLDTYSDYITLKTHSGFNGAPSLDLPTNGLISGRLWSGSVLYYLNIRDSAKEYYKNNSSISLITRTYYGNGSTIYTNRTFSLDIDGDTINTIDFEETLANALNYDLIFRVNYYISIIGDNGYRVESSSITSSFSLKPTISYQIPSNRSNWDGSLTVTIKYVYGLENYFTNYTLLLADSLSASSGNWKEETVSLDGSSTGVTGGIEYKEKYAVISVQNASYYTNYYGNASNGETIFPVAIKAIIKNSNYSFTVKTFSFNYTASKPTLDISNFSSSTLYSSWNTNVGCEYRAEPLLKASRLSTTSSTANKCYIYLDILDSSLSSVHTVSFFLNSYQDKSTYEYFELQLGSNVRKIMELIGASGYFKFKVKMYFNSSRIFSESSVITTPYDFIPDNQDLYLEGTGSGDPVNITSDPFKLKVRAKDGNPINYYFAGDNGIINKVTGSARMTYVFYTVTSTYYGYVTGSVICENFLDKINFVVGNKVACSSTTTVNYMNKNVQESVVINKNFYMTKRTPPS